MSIKEILMTESADNIVLEENYELRSSSSELRQWNHRLVTSLLHRSSVHLVVTTVLVSYVPGQKSDFDLWRLQVRYTERLQKLEQHRSSCTRG
jgi:hypothetical protein